MPLIAAKDVSEMPKPTDQRRYQAETERHLMVGAAIILLVIGGGLIWLLYGSGAFLSGVFCLAGALAIFALLFLLLKWFEKMGEGPDDDTS